MNALARSLLLFAFMAGAADDVLAQRQIGERHAVVPAGFIRIAVPEGAAPEDPLR